MKRLGIFFFYEKNGDVDDFITYYLRDLARNLTELIVVCNGKLSKQGTITGKFGVEAADVNSRDGANENNRVHTDFKFIRAG